jgi:uncharacterized membrane protein YfcA
VSDLWSVWPSTAVFVLAGAVKGVVGLGLPTVAMALLAQWMTPTAAAGLLLVPSFVTNVWQIGSWRDLRRMLCRFGRFQFGVCAGTWLGISVLGTESVWATTTVGITLILHAVWVLSGARFSVRLEAEKWLGPLIGGATGLMTAVTGVFVIPAVPYLQSLNLHPDELVQAMGLAFTTSTIALAIGLVANASYSREALATSTAMVLPALAGMYGGRSVRRVLSPAGFRTCLLVSLIALGAHLIARQWLAR